MWYQSTKLSQKEYLFIKKINHGDYTVSINIKNINQVVNLTKSIKNIFKDPFYPILIDEGGRVSRLKNMMD